MSQTSYQESLKINNLNWLIIIKPVSIKIYKLILEFNRIRSIQIILKMMMKLQRCSEQRKKQHRACHKKTQKMMTKLQRCLDLRKKWYKTYHKIILKKMKRQLIYQDNRKLQSYHKIILIMKKMKLQHFWEIKWQA